EAHELPDGALDGRRHHDGVLEARLLLDVRRAADAEQRSETENGVSHGRDGRTLRAGAGSRNAATGRRARGVLDAAPERVEKSNKRGHGVETARDPIPIR